MDTSTRLLDTEAAQDAKEAERAAAAQAVEVITGHLADPALAVWDDQADHLADTHKQEVLLGDPLDLLTETHAALHADELAAARAILAEAPPKRRIPLARVRACDKAASLAEYAAAVAARDYPGTPAAREALAEASRLRGRANATATAYHAQNGV